MPTIRPHYHGIEEVPEIVTPASSYPESGPCDGVESQGDGLPSTSIPLLLSFWSRHGAESELSALIPSLVLSLGMFSSLPLRHVAITNLIRESSEYEH